MCKVIEWKSEQKENIENIIGKIDDVVIFQISHFQNKMFNDPWLLTSHVIPMEMMKADNVNDLKIEAYKQLARFIKRIS